MFSCCSTVQQDKKLSDRITPCPIHSKPMLFVCKNIRTCIGCSLFCTDCADNHKGHDWQTVNNFFTPELTQLLTHYPVRPQDKIDDVFTQIHTDMHRFKTSIVDKVNQIENSLKKYENELKNKYPVLSKNTKGRQHRQIDSLKNMDVIDNQKMSAILKIYERQKNSQWLEDLYSDFNRIFQPTQKYIEQLLARFGEIAKGEFWDNQEKRKKNFNDYLEKSTLVSNWPNPFYFKFVEKYSSQFVNLQEDGTCLHYFNDNFSATTKPGAILSMPFTRTNNKVSFSVKKLQKKAFIFDSSVIYLGVCLPKLARQYDYANFENHSHSIFMINSKGKTFQRVGQDCKEHNSGISIGQGDEISIQIDFFTSSLNFLKKGTIKNSSFSMGLTIDKKSIQKLRAFICFQGQKGAKISVLPSQGTYRQRSIKNI